jgi:bifunctional DNA-binding transcriptional regulator/antitoxin component of YhaV-PrlF toxin-antitoxin module
LEATPVIITLQSRNTITIPRELRSALDLEPGMPLAARVEKGSLVLTPVAVVPRTVALSASGRAKEAEADEDIREGRVSEFESTEALLDELGRERGG